MGVSQIFDKEGWATVKVQQSRRGIAPHNVALGVPYEDRSEAEAKRWALVKALRDGTYKPPARSMTLKDFLEKYEAFYVAAAGPERRTARERTWRVGAGAQVRTALAWLTRQRLKTLADVTPRLCERWKDERLGAKRKLSTVKAGQAACHAAWAWACRRGYADANPWHGMTFPRRVKKDPRNLSALEVRKVFPAAAKLSADLHARMALALYAGLRLEETERLLQDALVWGRDGYIRLGPGKDGEPRTTLLPPELQTILAPLRRPQEPRAPLLGPCDYREVEKGVRGLAKGLAAPFTFRDLRKTFAGYLANELGVPVPEIASYLGHANITTTMGYYVARPRGVGEAGARVRFGVAADPTAHENERRSGPQIGRDAERPAEPSPRTRRRSAS